MDGWRGVATGATFFLLVHGMRLSGFFCRWLSRAFGLLTYLLTYYVLLYGSLPLFSLLVCVDVWRRFRSFSESVGRLVSSRLSAVCAN
ncbi:hypothetical protein P280DRAFT_467570, partial [Massarina eburnea CBS 473.64]